MTYGATTMNVAAYQPNLKFGTVNKNDLKPSILYTWDGIQANGKESLGAMRFTIHGKRFWLAVLGGARMVRSSMICASTTRN